jgi:circadian clock protein KaiC
MKPSPVPILRLPTGVPGLDAIVGGGIPELSFNLIAGGPGTGKTTLAHQFAFANATEERPAVIFTVLGEPTLKLLRYQQQYAFFDAAAINGRIRLVNLAREASTQDLGAVLARISAEVEASKPGIVIVDSFRSLTTSLAAERGVEHFVQTLAIHLTTWDVTSFLLGEYRAGEIHDPIFTVADGVLFLTQAIDRNSVVRKLQVVKMRGSAPMPGLHTYRITQDGVQAFPRILSQPTRQIDEPDPRRLSTGIAELDAMMNGGIPKGDAVVVAGPTGSGKTTLTAHFVAAAREAGEAVVLVVFEEFPRTYVDRARRLVDLDAMVADGTLEIIYLRPLDLSVDEALHEIRAAIGRIDASRVVIDSLSGFEVALAPTFREDFAESLYRLVGAILVLHVTVMMTVETVEATGGFRFKNDAVSFLTDDIIHQRYVDIDGRTCTVLEVLKMRGSEHSRELRLYTTGAAGIAIAEAVFGGQPAVVPP